MNDGLIVWLVVGGVFLAFIIWNVLGNLVAQVFYPTHRGDDDGRRLIYRDIFLVVMICIAVAVYGGGAALGYWRL